MQVILALAVEGPRVIRLLEQHHWRHVRTTGDHRIYRSTDGRGRWSQANWATMCVQAHGAILKQTGIEEPDK